MPLPDVPPWISVLRGDAPILLVAPHGGRRHDPRHPGKHKVNDLHTGEITRELAARLGATAILNEHVDRNQLDLNRVSQVRAGAAWFPALLAELLADMTTDGGRALVLVIHGWNVTQAVCDVGIGMRESGGEIVPVREGSETVTGDFVADRLRSLRRAAAARGLAVTIGSRYPAAHPNNLLQLFRALVGGDDECPVAAVCRRGTVDAVQLELAIPLRWPGRRREDFLAALTETLADPDPRPAERREPATTVRVRVGSGRLSRRRGLQLMADDLVVMTSIDAAEDGALGGRLLINRGPDRLALFTGELRADDAAWTIPPLAYEDRPDGGFRVRFRGPLLEFPTLLPFLDLERGLASGTLIEADVDLTFHPDGRDAAFGRVEGEIRLDATVHRVAAAGVAMRDPTMPRSLPAVRVTLPTGPWGPIALVEDPERAWSRDDDGRLTGALVDATSGAGIRAASELTMERTAGTVAITRDDTGARLAGTLERLIPVRRPGRFDAVIETTYAVVRVDGACVGWAEVTVILPPDADRGLTG